MYKNEGKPMLTLIDPLFIEEMARQQEIGDVKHATHHWMEGVDSKEILNAIKRHIAAIEQGEISDDGGKTLHTAAAACGLMYLAHYCRNQDRYGGFLNPIFPRYHTTGSEMGRRSDPAANAANSVQEAIRRNL